MTPTQELRAKLDELGVEYYTYDTIGMGMQNTYWNVGVLHYRYCERSVGITELTLCADCGITPEQAIAATVGAGTCKGEIDSDYFECKLTTFKCRSCGWSGIVDNGYAGYNFEGTDMPRHCPNCGARVVGE